MSPCLTSKDANFMGPVKYKISSAHELIFDGNKLRDLPDPIPCRDEIIPDPDSIPLSVLNHPIGKKNEINFAAYDQPELPLSPVEGAHPMFVLPLALQLGS